MSVEKRGKNSPYYYRFMVKGKQYQGSCIGCYKESDAKAYEKRLRAEVAKIHEKDDLKSLYEARRKELAKSGPITIAEAFDKSLEKPSRRTIDEKKLKQKRGVWKDFTAFMADRYPEITDIATVSVSHAEEYIALFRANGRYDKSITYQRGKSTVKTDTASGASSASTVKFYQNTCAEVFRKLARDAGIVENPFGEVIKPADDAETRDVFTPEELRLICDNWDSDVIKPLFMVALTTALREGDICTLRWKDVDFTTRVVRRIQNKTGKMTEIPMLDSLYGYLQERNRLPDKGGFVFPALEKMYRKESSSVSRKVKSFLKDLGIETTRKSKGRARSISVKDLHSCRHTFCYMAGMARIPLAVVQSIVGHMTPKMTLLYSSHASLEDKRKWMGVLQTIISVPQIAQNAGELLDETAERAELLQKLEALPTHELRRLVELAAPMDTKALPCFSAADRGGSAESGNNEVRS